MKLRFIAASNCHCSHPTSNGSGMYEISSALPICTYGLTEKSLCPVFWERKKYMLDLYDMQVPHKSRQVQCYSSSLRWIWGIVVKRNPLSRLWNVRHCLNILEKCEQCTRLLILYGRRHGRRYRSTLSHELWLKVCLGGQWLGRIMIRTLVASLEKKYVDEFLMGTERKDIYILCDYLPKGDLRRKAFNNGLICGHQSASYPSHFCHCPIDSWTKWSTW